MAFRQVHSDDQASIKLVNLKSGDVVFAYSVALVPAVAQESPAEYKFLGHIASETLDAWPMKSRTGQAEYAESTTGVIGGRTLCQLQENGSAKTSKNRS